MHPYTWRNHWKKNHCLHNLHTAQLINPLQKGLRNTPLYFRFPPSLQNLTLHQVLSHAPVRCKTMAIVSVEKVTHYVVNVKLKHHNWTLVSNNMQLHILPIHITCMMAWYTYHIWNARVNNVIVNISQPVLAVSLWNKHIINI